jgi:hypothetical protein
MVLKRLLIVRNPLSEHSWPTSAVLDESAHYGSPFGTKVRSSGSGIPIFEDLTSRHERVSKSSSEGTSSDRARRALGGFEHVMDANV